MLRVLYALQCLQKQPQISLRNYQFLDRVQPDRSFHQRNLPCVAIVVKAFRDQKCPCVKLYGKLSLKQETKFAIEQL